MSQQDVSIIWKGCVVGVIANLQIDHFDIYGKWMPGDGPAVKAFLEEITSVGEATVRLGSSEPKWMGTVETVPEEVIEIKWRPHTSAV